MIRVNEDWVIMVDSLNYMPCKDLHRTKTVKQKDGTFVDVDEYSNPIGFFSTLSGALKGIMQYEFRTKVQDVDIDIKEAIKIIDKQNYEMEVFLGSCDVKAGIE